MKGKNKDDSGATGTDPNKNAATEVAMEPVVENRHQINEDENART